MKSTASRASAVSQTRGFGDLLYDKAGARPSLDLDFAGTGSLRDKITGEHLVDHTRASTGTYIDSEGLVKQSTKNHFPYSEDLTQWITTISNGQVTKTFDSNSDNPYGSGGATKITCTRVVASNAAWLRSQAVNVGTAGIVTVSAWLKAATPSDVGKMVSVWMFDGGFKFHQQINLTSDWVRYSFTSTSTDGNIGEPANFGLVASNFQVDGVSNLETSVSFYIWGAQLETGSTATEYVKTTGAANSAPRFTHERVETGNLLLNSQNLHYWWIATNSFVAGRTLAPDGTYSATVFGSDGSGHDINIRPVKANGNPGITLKPNTTYTYSIYAKLESGSAPTSGNILPTLYGQGVVPFNGNLTTEWKRFSTTFTTGTGSLNQAFYTGVNANTTAEIAYWGAQLEENDAASTYVPSIDTFTSRASSATYVDSAGLIKTAHRNLLRHSETLSNGVWIKSSFSHVANETTTAPDGSTVPWSDLGSYVYQDGTVTGAGTFTNSVYLKAETPCTVHLRKTDNDNSNVPCNVTTEWQRFTTTGTKTGGGGPTYTRLLIDNRQNTTANTVKIAIWGAQQVKGTEAGDYAKTEATSTGAARYSHDPETLTPTGLYLEPQGINYAKQSSGSYFTYSDVTAPDGSNNVHNNETSASVSYIHFSTNNYTPTVGETITASYWVKKRGSRSTHTGIGENKVFFSVRKWASSIAASFDWRYNIVTKTVEVEPTGTTIKFEDYPNGWIRVSHTFTVDSAFTTNTNMVFSQYAGGNTSNHVDTPYIWGVQFEKNSYASSYIPTIVDSTSSFTRAADVYTSTPNLTETFEPRGLLIEEARTNLATKSHLVGDADANGDWQRDGSRGSTPSNPNYTNPMGTTEGLRTMQENGNNSVHNMYHINNPLDGTAKCTTVFVKPLRDDRDIQLRAVGIGGNSPVTTFDAHKGIITMNLGLSGTTNGGVGWTMGEPFIKEYANGWYRIGWTNLAMTSLGTSGWKFGIYLVPKGNTAAAPIYQGTDEDSFSCWGVQYEEGSFPTSYIHNTTTSSLNRSADIASISGDNFGTYRTNYIGSKYTIYSPSSQNVGHSQQNNAALGPFNKFDATKLTRTSSDNMLRYSPTGHNQGSLSANSTYTYTGYWKKGTADVKYLHFRSSGAHGKALNLDDLSTSQGHYESGNTVSDPIAFSATNVGNGWVKVSMTYSSVGTLWIHVSKQAGDVDGANSRPDTGDTIFVANEQVEQTSSPTNFIENLPTFTSRLGNATYVDSNGLIKNSVVNLFRYSQPTTRAHFNDYGTNAHLNGNYATAPDGTQTAARLTMANAGFTYMRMLVPVEAGKTYTYSVYVKSNSTTLDKTRPQIASVGLAESIEEITLTDEWVRYTRTFTSTITGDAKIGFDNGPQAIDHLVWGFQVEEGDTATEYINTQPAGAASGAARYSHDPETLVPTGLYLEPAATNEITRSTEMQGGNSGSLREDNTLDVVAPDGTNTAVRHYATAGGYKYTFPYGLHNNSNLAGVLGKRLSYWIKKGDYDEIRLTNGQHLKWVFSTKSFINSGTYTYNESFEEYPNGWFRLSYTIPENSNTTHTLIGVNPATADTTLAYYWGFQLEDSSHASSYIPTSGSTVTRAADTYTSTATTVLDRDGGNKEAWYNYYGPQTYLLEHQRPQGAWKRIWIVGKDNNTGSFSHTSTQVFWRGSAAQPERQFDNGAGVQFQFMPSLSDQTHNYKYGVAMDVNDAQAFDIGTLTGTDTSVTLPTGIQTNMPDKVTIGVVGNNPTTYMSSPFARITYWKTRLPNTSLIQISNK